MSYVFTVKAERDGLGAAGDSASPKDDAELSYWLAHGYIAVGAQSAPYPVVTDADLTAPEEDGMLHKGEDG